MTSQLAPLEASSVPSWSFQDAFHCTTSFRTRTNWTKLNLGHISPSLTFSLPLCFFPSLRLLSVMLLNHHASFLSQTGNLVKTDTKNIKRSAGKDVIAFSPWLHSTTSSLKPGRPQQNILKSATYWSCHYSLPQHGAINSHPSRTLNTCCDSTQKHADYFYSLRVSERSAPSHATSPNGWLIITQCQLENI